MLCISLGIVSGDNVNPRCTERGSKVLLPKYRREVHTLNGGRSCRRFPKGFEEQTVQQKLTYTNTFYRIVNETITGEFCEVCTGRKCQARESKWFSSIQWALQSLSTAINLGSLAKQAVSGGTRSHVIFSNMEVQRWLGSTCFLTLRLPYGRSIKCQCSKSS